ncbi:MAG: DNA (cytosine-5-)-methyltransferase [Bacilli bacterium]|nr:DNA (cytosine-5-)-methyltransferase [Bacilli bacterium]
MRLKVFEAFAGIGAQASALKRLNIDYEVVGISEWFIDAILCYDQIQNDGKPEIELPTKEEQIKYLKQFTFSKDSVHPIEDISKLNEDLISQLYKANKRTNNYGSIVDIANEKIEMPDIDLLTYSFPCQDLSTGGLTKGMKKGSGTRSGLLWEIEKILLILKREKRLPKYLLMENVKAILAPSNKEDLNQWLNFLESIGYQNNDPMILDATKFGIPQDRKRCFIISRLGKKKLNIKPSDLETNEKWNCLDFIMQDYSRIDLKNEADEAQLYPTYSRLKMWEINKREPIKENTIIHTITCNMDRSNTAAMLYYEGAKGKSFRLLTIREAFLLMGFTESDYIKAKRLGLSYRKLNKLIGNSIVVNILTEIFRYLFETEYGVINNEHN